MRVRIVKDHKQYKKGEIVDVSRNVAFGLVDSGAGIVSKDMSPGDYETANKPVNRVRRHR